MSRGNARVGALIAAVVVCLAGLLLTEPARAQGIGITPGVIKIDDAVRGSEYSKLLTLFNQGSAELTFEIAREGQAAAWASLHPVTEPDKTVDQVVIPARTTTRFILRIAVPPDAANGIEDGTVNFQSLVTDDQSPAGQGRMSVNTGMSVKLAVNVGGVQKLSGAVLDSYADDVEVGEPVLIKTTFSNTGNVKAQPEVKAAVKDGSDEVLGEAKPSDAAVGPGQTVAVESLWDTKNRELGAYTANVTVALGGQQIYNQDISFDVVAVGALKTGLLQKIVLENEPLPGSAADIAAHFENTTHEDTKARFVAEVYRGKQLIDAITTEEQAVGGQKEAQIKASFNIAENGKYKVRGKVVYGGRETETKELTFRVGPAPAPPLWAIASAAAAGFILTSGIAFGSFRFIRRRREA